MAPGQSQVRSRLGLLLMVGFLLGFPAVGLYAFWNEGHRRVRESALPAGRAIALEILQGREDKVLEEAGTNEFRLTKPEERLDADRDRLGRFIELGPLRSARSWAGGREDMVWQFVALEGEARFERGSATLKMTVARRTMAPEWRLESFDLE